MSNTIKEVLAEVGKASPPVSVSGMMIAGFPLSDWVLLLTAVYTLVQLYFTIKKNMRRKDYDERQSED